MKLLTFLVLLFSMSSLADASPHCSERDKEIYGHNRDFMNTWHKCGRDTLGDGPATERCIRTSYPELTLLCSQCFGAFTACGAIHCRSACFWDSHSSRCASCGLQYCGAAWEECTGSSKDLISEQTPQLPIQQSKKTSSLSSYQHCPLFPEVGLRFS